MMTFLVKAWILIEFAYHQMFIAFDLIHVEAKYHRCCSRSFMREAASSENKNVEKKRLGRPKDMKKNKKLLK